MNVVIVESAAKAKAINKYLGSNYKVSRPTGTCATCRPRTARSSPTRTSRCTGTWTASPQKVMKEIADAVKDADKLILATDPDREGEAISWHILRILEEKKALKKGVPVERVDLQRRHQAVRAGRASRRRARSMRRWSRPIWPAARSTISSASRSRRCCGASCRAPARPAACSRWRCGSCATARPRSRPSRPTNTGPSRPLLATAKGEEFAARLNAIAGKKLDKLDIKDEATRQRHQGRHREGRLPRRLASRRRR